MSLLARLPVGKLQIDLSSGGTPVSTGAWVQLFSATPAPCCAVEIFNGTGSILKLSTGTPGNEAASEIPYFVLPNGSHILLPLTIAKGLPLSAIAVDSATTSGRLVMNLFG
jgi:hypothetical protein